MPEPLTAFGLDSLELIVNHGNAFERIVGDFPNTKHSFVFRDGEILGRFENEDGIISFYPNGAFFGFISENWG